MTVINFGCIGPDGVTVALDDIVCLVGANNSGKSTVLRAYEAAVTNAPITKDDVYHSPGEKPTSVELVAHIPAGAANIAEAWKEAKDGLLLVKSLWTWATPGKGPVRTTWDPTSNAYAEDGKAAGLDTVFNSRLPQPYRIGSLDNPDDEHKKLLGIVLEPVISRFKQLASDDESPLAKSISGVRVEADKPVQEFREQLDAIQSKVDKSYRNVFSAAQVKLTVALGDFEFDLTKSLTGNSRIEVSEPHGITSWKQQGTGSQRALFWSMLEVRSALHRSAEEKKQRTKTLEKLESDIKKKEKDRDKAAKPDTKQKHQDEIDALKKNLTDLQTEGSENPTGIDEFLPGYMLLIDEPETALHPSAVRAAKEHLYALASESGWQVMLSTHHPGFIDPLKDHTTVVRLHRNEATNVPNVFRTDTISFSNDEKFNLKALLAFDSTVTEMFFGAKVVVVEGDTEFAAFSEVMNSDLDKYPLDARPLVLRARGKATIPVLARMLAHFKVPFAILHDIDSPRTKDGGRVNSAYTTNTLICEQVTAARAAGLNVTHLCSCPGFEQHHGLQLTAKEKPFLCWQQVSTNQNIRDAVEATLTRLLEGVAPADQTDGSNFESTLKTWITANNVATPQFAFS